MCSEVNKITAHAVAHIDRKWLKPHFFGYRDIFLITATPRLAIVTPQKSQRRSQSRHGRSECGQDGRGQSERGQGERGQGRRG